MVYHFVILNASEGSVYIYLCLQILRKAQNDRLSDSAIGVLTHPLFYFSFFIGGLTLLSLLALLFRMPSNATLPRSAPSYLNNYRLPSHVRMRDLTHTYA